MTVINQSKCLFPYFSVIFSLHAFTHKDEYAAICAGNWRSIENLNCPCQLPPILTLTSSCRGLTTPSSISILYSVSWVEAKVGRWSAAPLGAGGSWLGVSRYVMMGEKAGCCSKEGGVGNMRWRSATAERRQ